MEVYAQTLALKAAQRPRPAVVAIGNFDGVHIGHQRLFALARERATALSGETVALTFEPHPARVLAPELAPPLLCTRARKRELIAEQGIDVLVFEPFTPALAALDPRAFVDDVLVRDLGAREVVVGYDFTYGRERGGTAATLERAGAERGFDVRVVPQVTAHGLVASSTKIREFLHEGNVSGAHLLLGRDFDVDGQVVRGAGRGATIGVPTANIAVEGELLPRRGVYAVRMRVAGGEWQPGAANLGVAPTFTAGGGAAAPSLEVHLLDYRGGDLYGSHVRVAFHAWLRAEKRFPDADALVAQIRSDIARARAALATEEPVHD